jgi:hypothetical protein
MYDTEFENFLDAYPAARRVDNARARAAFTKAIQQVPIATLIAAVQQHRNSTQWRKHIVPSMLTWLEERRWIQVLPEPEPLPGRETPYEQARRRGLLIRYKQP